MKTIEINFREPNIDRFVEIIATSIKFGFNFYIHFKNKPLGYNQFLKDMGIDFTKIKLQNESDFIVEFDPNINFDRLFQSRLIEPVEEIKKRIESVTEIENPILDQSGGVQILKTASEKLQISKDDIQNIISLSCVIAAMEGEKEKVKAHYISEAIQYVIPKYEVNE